MKEVFGNRLSVEWYSFPLEQVNSTQGPGWTVWEQPDEYKSRGLWAFRGGEAARLQGKELFERFHMGLLRARHVEKRDIANPEVLMISGGGEVVPGLSGYPFFATSLSDVPAGIELGGAEQSWLSQSQRSLDVYF